MSDAVKEYLAAEAAKRSADNSSSEVMRPDYQLPESDYDFKGKMQEVRAIWKEAGTTNLSSFIVPNEYADYFRAMAAVATGKHLIALVEAGNQTMISAFANKRLPKGYNRNDIEHLRITLLGNEKIKDQHDMITEELAALLAWVKKREPLLVEGKVAASGGDNTLLMHNWAYEYAITYYIKGKYEMLAALPHVDMRGILL